MLLQHLNFIQSGRNNIFYLGRTLREMELKGIKYYKKRGKGV